MSGITVPDPQVGDVVHPADDRQEPASANRDQQTEEDESTAGAAGLIYSHIDLTLHVVQIARKAAAVIN